MYFAFGAVDLGFVAPLTSFCITVLQSRSEVVDKVSAWQRRKRAAKWLGRSPVNAVQGLRDLFLQLNFLYNWLIDCSINK